MLCQHLLEMILYFVDYFIQVVPFFFNEEIFARNKEVRLAHVHMAMVLPSGDTTAIDIELNNVGKLLQSPKFLFDVLANGVRQFNVLVFNGELHTLAA